MRHKKRRAAEGVLIGMAWYRADQWARLLDVSADRDDLEDAHEEWERGAIDRCKDLQADGFQVRKCDVDVEALVRWCAERKRPVDAKSRAAYAAERLRALYADK